MSLHRRNPKRDANEPAIVDALARCGFAVRRLSAVGCPDLLVGRGGLMWLVEVKTQKGTHTKDQRQWLMQWTGPKPIVVRSVDDAIAFVRQTGMGGA